MAKHRVSFFGASGNNAGSGIRNVLELCRQGKLPSVKPGRIISCNLFGGVAAVAEEFGVPFYAFPYEERHTDAAWQRMWDECESEYLVLLGCSILARGLYDMNGKVINEHPALLSLRSPHPPYPPLFGGKGMTDLKVHEAVINLRSPLGLTKSGTTTHFVVFEEGREDVYDSGPIISEHVYELQPHETARSLQEEVKQLQRKKTPQDIEDVVSGKVQIRHMRRKGWFAERDMGDLVLRR